MEDDNSRAIDDSGVGQQRESKKSTRSLKKKITKKPTKTSDGSVSDEHKKQLAEAAEVLDALPDELRIKLIETKMSKEWSGLLPDPDSFNKYPSLRKNKWSHGMTCR